MPTKILERKAYFAGDVVFDEGQMGRAAYVVEAGEVEISKTVNGEEMVLGKVTVGGIFGEMALIDDQPRMATATAAKQTTLVIIPRSTFETKLENADPFIRALLGIFVKNIRSVTEGKLGERAGGTSLNG